VTDHYPVVRLPGNRTSQRLRGASLPAVVHNLPRLYRYFLATHHVLSAYHPIEHHSRTHQLPTRPPRLINPPNACTFYRSHRLHSFLHNGTIQQEQQQRQNHRQTHKHGRTLVLFSLVLYHRGNTQRKWTKRWSRVNLQTLMRNTLLAVLDAWFLRDARARLVRRLHRFEQLHNGNLHSLYT
jgi:hypothetical protein